jgi:hypothetical protein
MALEELFDAGTLPELRRAVLLPSSLFEHPAAESSGDDSAGLRGHHREHDHVA